ncbi:MAG TPA: glycosyltransferase [Leptolyngbyaceae cyanobacterium M33_DOE_097]|nr:glycosyltransferase [Leptolyngbyaceae cyanobacterium M33_DOE_097]
MKVSVLMSVYNGEEYLQESIDSILNQTFSDFEFLIIDDCSTDNTWQILSQYREKDPRIVLVKNSENLGLTKSLNKGLKLAQGQYIARQDADDISFPQRFEKEVRVLDEQADCVLVSCNIQLIQGRDQKVIEVMHRSCSPELVNWYLLFYNHVAGHSQVMYRRNDAIALGGYSEQWLYSEDYELWCRFAKSKKKLVILPEVLLTYRQHNQSISAQKAKKQEAYVTSLVQENIEQLTHAKLKPEEIRVLVGFWKATLKIVSGDAYRRFPEATQAEWLHQQLIEIKQSFVREYSSTSGVDLEAQINRAIGKQFLAWLQSPLTSRHSIWSKIQISRYVFLWSPLNVPKGWLIWFLRFPSDSATSIFRKLQSLGQETKKLNIEGKPSA